MNQRMNKQMKWILCLLCLGLVSLWVCDELYARGGRGGGGRGGGGRSRSASRPSHSRSPSARSSRPQSSSRSRPSSATRPSAGTRPSPGRNPSKGQVRDFLDVKQPSRGTGRLGRDIGGAVAGGVAGGAAAEFLTNRPSTGQRPAGPGGGERPGAGRPGGSDRPGGDRPGGRDRPGQRPSDLAGNRPDRISNRDQVRDQRQQRHDQINDRFRNHPSHLPAYGRGFWGRYPHGRWHLHNHRHDWWRWASWGALTGWVASGWGEPVYYNYGDNVYYEGDSVYSGDQVVASTDEYAEQAQSIATNLPDVEPDTQKWLPLGVFAVTQDGQSSGPDPTIFLQLAISKNGIIAGTLQNTATDKVNEIEGMVDKDSQRAAWSEVGGDWPIMETGIYNLTEDESPALVHFADGQTQQWLLVRLEEPKGTPESN